MVWHLIWEEGERKIEVRFLLVLCHSLKRASATLFLFPKTTGYIPSCLHPKILALFSCRVDASGCLDGVIASLAEVRIFHPAFGRCAVCHRQCAVPWAEASIDNVYPQRDHCHEELKQIV